MPAPLSSWRARPKSISTTRPARVSMMFSGLTSRWTRPALWIASKPRQELRGDVLGLLEVQRSALLEHLEQRAAVDVLHRHQLAAVDLDQVEDSADVWRNHLAGGTDFTAQTGHGAAHL